MNIMMEMLKIESLTSAGAVAKKLQALWNRLSINEKILYQDNFQNVADLKGARWTAQI